MNIRSYIKLILDFRHYKNGPNLKELHNKLAEMYVNQSGSKIITDEERSKILLTENGRGAFLIFLRSLKLTPGDEVIVPAYTCPVIPAAILTAGLKPVYAEVERDLTMKVEEIEKCLSPKTKAILVQHTYCMESDMDQIMEFAKEKGLLVIEDCAHCIGFKKDGRYLGLKGDVALFSFGNNKVLPTRAGGFLLVNNDQILEPILEEYSKVKFTSRWHTFRWMINPLLWRLFRKAGINRADKLAILFSFLGLVDLPVDDDEIQGKIAKRFPTRLSNPLAGVVLYFMNELDEQISHMEKITKIYQEEIKKIALTKDLLFECEFLEGGPYLYLPLIMKDPKHVDKVCKVLRASGYYVFGSKDVPVRKEGFEALHYPADKLKTTKLAEKIVILRTGLIIDENDARFIINKVQSTLEAEIAG